MFPFFYTVHWNLFIIWHAFSFDGFKLKKSHFPFKLFPQKHIISATPYLCEKLHNSDIYLYCYNRKNNEGLRRIFTTPITLPIQSSIKVQFKQQHAHNTQTLPIQSSLYRKQIYKTITSIIATYKISEHQITLIVAVIRAGFRLSAKCVKDMGLV